MIWNRREFFEGLGNVQHRREFQQNASVGCEMAQQSGEQCRYVRRAILQAEDLAAVAVTARRIKENERISLSDVIGFACKIAEAVRQFFGL